MFLARRHWCICLCSKVHSVCWNADGRYLASGSFDKTAAVYCLERDRFVKGHIYRGHNASVDQLRWHRTNPDLFATASGDKTVRIWDNRTTKSAGVTSTKGENINIAWSPDGKTIAVGNKEDLITFIDTRTNKIRVEEPFSFEVNEISWNNTNDLFFLTNGLGCMHVLSYPSLEHQMTLKAHPANCICIEFGPTGKDLSTYLVELLLIHNVLQVNILPRVRRMPKYRCGMPMNWPACEWSVAWSGPFAQYPLATTKGCLPQLARISS